MTQIKTSLDWNDLESRLLHKTFGLSYEIEVRKMIGNIKTEVTALSKAEVEARQGKTHRAIDLLNKINNDIEVVEEFLLVAALLG